MSSSDLPLFILDGNGPCLNRGCEAILRTTLTILDTAFGEARYISSPGSGPSDRDKTVVVHPNLKHLSAQRVGLKARMRRRLNHWFGIGERPVFHAYLSDAAAVLELGGDNLTLDYGPPNVAFSRMEAIRRLGKPVVIWGASIGPFSSEPELEYRYLSWLKQADLIFARETETQKYLAEHGVIDNVILVADPAFLLDPVPVSLPAEQSTALLDGAVGINMSPLLGRYLDGSDGWIERAVSLLLTLDREVDRPIFLIPHVIKPNNDDHMFLSTVRSMLGGTKNPIHLLGPDYDARQIKWVIGQLSLFIGARTHATIAAMSSGVPTISLGYSAKAKGINQDVFGHQGWLIPVEQLTSEKLADVIANLLAHSSAVQHELSLAIPHFRQLSLASGQYLHNFLMKSHHVNALTDKI